jgi:hypothetical protein
MESSIDGLVGSTCNRSKHRGHALLTGQSASFLWFLVTVFIICKTALGYEALVTLPLFSMSGDRPDEDDGKRLVVWVKDSSRPGDGNELDWLVCAEMPCMSKVVNVVTSATLTHNQPTHFSSKHNSWRQMFDPRRSQALTSLCQDSIHVAHEEHICRPVACLSHLQYLLLSQLMDGV